jgi:hypothetical protein
VPAAPTFSCGAPLGSLTIDLPCQVGVPLAPQSAVSAVECNVHGTTASGKVSFLIPLDQLARNLDRAVDLAGFPAAPIYGVGAMKLQALGGSAVFSAVDVPGRAFLGRFAGATLVFSPGGAVCRIADGLFWGVPGDFR